MAKVRLAALKIGLIVNPVAGLGGSVALKGSDGEGTVRRALALGAVPRAPERAEAALRVLTSLAGEIEVLAAPGVMGEIEARAAGLPARALGDVPLDRLGPADASPGGLTTPADTRAAAQSLVRAGVDLLLFAGGDGTARDVYDALAALDPLSDPSGTGATSSAFGPTAAGAGHRATGPAVPPVIGIPAGCKIHSAVYAATPTAAGELARRYLSGLVTRVTELEVMDIDEEAFRRGDVVARLYGFLPVPEDRRLTQGAKVGGRGLSDAAAARAIAERVVEDMEPGRLYLLGPGSTTRAVKDRLGLEGTLLGVDAVVDGRLVARDATENELLDLLGSGPPAMIVVTVIGGQGYIFGRGNQQLSPAVIRRVGVGNVVVIASQAKLAALPLGRLRVDTGDAELDAALRGYRRVITSHREEAVLRVE